MERKISPLHILTILAFFALTWVFGADVPVERPGGRQFLAPPPEHMELFSFGFNDSVADSLWLRWIQDGDTCQTYSGAENPNPIQGQTGEFANPRHKVCDNSWAFKMLDQITRVAPKFNMPYQAGAITLSVLVEDYDGAKIIFDRGIAQFPNDWHLLYKASYHYLYDRHDLTRAAELMVQAQKAGAPPFLTLLAARLYTKSGQAEIGIKTLEEYRKGLTDEKDIAKIDVRIAELKKQMKQ
jgi:hypothetical protein